MKRKFSDTQFAQTAGFNLSAKSMLKFVVDNQSSVWTLDDLRSLIKPIHTTLKTSTSQIFDLLTNRDCLSNFAVINVSSKETNIPELLTASNITLDLKYIPGSDILRPYRQLANKVLVNITSCLNKNRSLETETVNDIASLQAFFIRGQYCLTYQDDDDWLGGSLTEYILKSYSIILSAMISRQYSLDLQDQIAAGMWFAAFMASRLDNDTGIPRMLYRATWFTSQQRIREFIQENEEILSRGIKDLDELCQHISQITPRMKNFNDVILRSICGSLGPDNLTSRIALEYPPYWAYLILCALSGDKMSLLYQLNNNRLTNEGRSKYLAGMFQTNHFYQVRGR